MINYNMQRSFSESQISDTALALIQKHGEENSARIKTGVKQVADLWQEEDGNLEVFQNFCLANFVVSQENLDDIFNRFQDNFEQINGHFHEIGLCLSESMQVERKKKLPIDQLFSSYRPDAHFVDDFFKNKLAFVLLLNFKSYSLEEMLREGDNWSREDWAKARLASVFSERVPASVYQRIMEAYVAADDYIMDYNIYLESVRAGGDQIFTDVGKLISHWGLRDHIKGLYASPNSLQKQRIIAHIMNRVVCQSIPGRVINDPEAMWNPYVDTDEPESCTRYEHLLSVFEAVKRSDEFYSHDKTYIDRKFNKEREIPEETVEGLIVDFLSSPVAREVGQFVSNRLGRSLEPFDIWFNQFEARDELEELNALVKQKYPTLEALQASCPSILMKLGFDSYIAHSASDKIAIDPGRSAGHATDSPRREGKHRLRIRFLQEDNEFVPDYPGFNTFMHEFGHGVEMYLSTHRMDHNLLRSVPNLAFTEALAFVFQDKTQEVLGLSNNNERAKHLKLLKLFWNTFEMAGVSLVDMRIWRWMYANPNAKKEELRDAVVEIAKEVWNTYYAQVFGVRDQEILAVYSHIVHCMMYIPDYFLGSLIQHQIQEYLNDKDLAREVERMYTLGSLTPDMWMKLAVDSSISAHPLIRSTEEALKALEE